MEAYHPPAGATWTGVPPTPIAEVAARVLASTLPGTATLARSDIDTMLDVEVRTLAELSPPTRKVVASAIIRARVYSGNSEAAVELADFEAQSALHDRRVELAAETLSACCSALSEAYLSAGQSRRGNEHARCALDYAREAGDQRCLYRASSLLACNLALDGEFARAATEAARATSLAHANPWEPNTSALPLIGAEMLINYASLDAAALESVIDRLNQVEHKGPAWTALRRLATGWLHMLRGHYAEALQAAGSITNGSDQPSVPGMVHTFALGLAAMAMIHRSEAHRALALLHGAESPRGHAVCFNLQRATAHLQLGENREALAATEDCLRLGQDHCLRTLPSILMRRALAFNRLGRPEAADSAFAEAFHIMHAAGALTPLLGLPGTELGQLLDRMVESRPDLIPLAEDLRLRAASRPQIQPPAFAVPQLTARESVVVARLQSGLTLIEIAAQLHVSRNTLKSQLRTLYAKLGATSRADAVLRLECAGYFHRIPRAASGQ